MSPKSAMTPSTAPKLDYKVICIGSREVRIILRTMKRKTLRLSINEVGEVEVRMPPRYPQREVANFISQHHRWIEQRLQHVEGQQANKRLHMRYLGDKYSYQTYDGEALSVSAPHIFYPEQWSQSRLEAEVDAWLRIRSRCYLQQRIDHWWPAFEKGALINKPVLRIKKMRTRWGSLSSKGNINLNMQLMTLPPELIELVVVHELCHSHHFNHGPSFHRLMAEMLPSYRRLEGHLRQLEKQLLSR